MKKRFYTFLVALVAIASGAQAQVAINATNFPDENFRNWLLDANNINGYGADGQLTATEIADIKELNIKNQDIANLKGLEYFTSMTDLYLDSNPLTSVDVSMFPQLEILAIGFLNLTSIDLSNNTKLKQMRFTGNQLTSLDFTKYPDLEVLLIGMNPMASVDVTQNPKLKRLSIIDVPISSLDLTKNTALETLEIGKNNLTSLDLSKNTKLKSLDVTKSDVTAWDFTPMTKLEKLYFFDSKGTTFDLRKCAPLKEVKIDNSELTTLDMSGLAALESFYVDGSTVGTVNASGCQNLEWPVVKNNSKVTTLNVSNCPTVLWAYALNSTIGSANLSGCPALLDFVLDEGMGTPVTQIKSIDFSGCSSLQIQAYYDNNGIESLNFTDCTSIDGITCANQKLTSLKVAGCSALVALDCSNNQLTYLDLSGCTALKNLSIYSNNIHMGAMQAIVEALPDRTSSSTGTLFAVDTKDANEGNVITKDQVEAVYVKRWYVRDINGGDWTNYAGVDTGIESIENAQGAIHNYYTLDGRKVVNPTKGVYIVNGHKVVIK